MMDILSHSTTAWVAISFVVFIVLVVKLAGAKITGALDSRISLIKADIETAERLKKEAQDLLNEFQAKQHEAEDMAMRIIEDAKASARLVHEAAEADLAISMERREAQLVQRLKRMEDKAIEDIKNHAADLAIKATREIVVKSLDAKAGDTLIDQAIQSASKYIN